MRLVPRRLLHGFRSFQEVLAEVVSLSFGHQLACVKLPLEPLINTPLQQPPSLRTGRIEPFPGFSLGKYWGANNGNNAAGSIIVVTDDREG